MNKKLRNIMCTGALALELWASPSTAQEPHLNLGYNVLETAISIEKDQSEHRPVRNRLMTNVSLSLKGIETSYSGLNELNDWNSETYFGSNKFMIGKKGFSVKLLAKTKATKSGLIDTKLGFRDQNIMKTLRGYGYAELGANKQAVEVVIFYGKGLGKGTSIELFQDTTLPFRGRTSHHTEVQTNKSLTDRLSLFGRMEASDFNVKEATYLAGMGFNLGTR